jgi:hypothetical protein
VARQLLWSGIVPALILLLAPFVVIIFGQGSAIEVAQHLKPWCMVTAGLWTAGALVSAWAAKGGKVEVGLIALAIPVMAAHQVALYAAEDVVGPARSSMVLSEQIKPHLTHATHIYTVGVYPQSLPVYLGRTVTLVNFRGELDFGLGREPAKGLSSTEDFLKRWAVETDAIAVMRKQTYGELERVGTSMRVIAEDRSHIAVQTQ